MSSLPEDVSALVHCLKNESPEGIRAEFLKIVMSRNPEHYFREYRMVFEYVIPEITPLVGFQQYNRYHIYDIWEHSLMVLHYAAEQSDDKIIRLAALFHDFGKPDCFTRDEFGRGHFYSHGEASSRITESVMRRLQFDQDSIDLVCQLVRYHDNMFSISARSIRKWLNVMGEEQFRRLLILKSADVKGHNPVYLGEGLEKVKIMEIKLNDLLEQQQCFQLHDMAIDGNELLSLGAKPGKTIGIILNRLFSKIIEGSLENEQGALINEAVLLIEECTHDD